MPVMSMTSQLHLFRCPHRLTTIDFLYTDQVAEGETSGHFLTIEMSHFIEGKLPQVTHQIISKALTNL